MYKESNYNEIVFSVPLFARAYSERPVLLRLFIEHALFTNDSWSWQNPLKSGLVWRAMYHHESLVVHAHVESVPSDEKLRPVVPFLAAGKRLNGFGG